MIISLPEITTQKKIEEGKELFFLLLKNDKWSYPADQVKKQFQVYKLKKG